MTSSIRLHKAFRRPRIATPRGLARRKPGGGVFAHDEFLDCSNPFAKLGTLAGRMALRKFGTNRLFIGCVTAGLLLLGPGGAWAISLPTAIVLPPVAVQLPTPAVSVAGHTQ